jgi:hypothetical protein
MPAHNHAPSPDSRLTPTYTVCSIAANATMPRYGRIRKGDGVPNRRLASCLLLLATLLVPASLSPCIAAAATQWNPSASYTGGSQADPRLDRPIGLWCTGSTLSEVFAHVLDQTGVRLGFRSLGDDENPRVRVNLYLNRSDPPSLRDVMAQLSWVLDCTFCMQETDGEKSYLLMSTNLASGAAQRLQERESRASEAAARQQERYRDLIRAELAELGEALKLTPAEAAKHYRGVDDALLSALLDPSRRAAAELVCRKATAEWLRHDEYATVHGAQGSPAANPDHWMMPSNAMLLLPEDWGPDGRRLLRQLTGLSDEALNAAEFSVQVEGASDGFLILGVLQHVADDGEGGHNYWHPVGRQTEILNVRDDFMMPWRDELALARLVGEDVTPEREATCRESWSKRRDAMLDRRAQERFASAVAETSSLSPEAASLLSGLVLGLDPGDPRHLWEVQQAVAEASGLNVISDRFLGAPRRLRTIPNRVAHADFPKMTAFNALAASCLVLSDTDRPDGTIPWGFGMEWGDAGRFLRFRSQDRAIWRAAMLPQAWLDWADAVAASALDDAGRSGAHAVDLSVPMRLDEWSAAAAGLTDVQAQYAALMAYGDPADPVVACREAVLRALLSTASQNLLLFRFLGSLTEGQRAAVLGDGLHCDTELRPEQVRLLVEALQQSANVTTSTDSVRRFGYFIRIAEPDGQTEPSEARYVMHCEETVSPPADWRLPELPLALRVRADLPEHQLAR